MHPHNGEPDCTDLQLGALSVGLHCGLMEQRLWQMGLSGKIELIKDGEECKHRV